MPFNRRLAIAIEELGASTPFVSQKALKHVLVGVEKLVKTFTEQSRMQSQGILRPEIIRFVNEERVKCGLIPIDDFLTGDEIKARDAEIFRILETDISAILAHIQHCEAPIYAKIHGWLKDAERAGIVVEDIGLRHTGVGVSSKELSDFALSNLLKSPEFIEAAVTLANRLIPIDDDLKRVRDHIELNITAIK